MKNILYSKGKNDECYTPAYGVWPIIKYIPSGAIVWCPFDKKESEFVRIISRTHHVERSHIDDGLDFFDYEPDKWDVIVSNPPFTNKRAFFERAISLQKPFALIMSNTWLNDAAPKEIFGECGLQLLMFDKRMRFKNNGTIENKITFSSSYFCRDFLPRDIVLERLRVPPPN